MQKLRGYLALGIFIMDIVSLLCLLLPLIEITDDALLLMVFAVPPLICGLIIALALHMLLYTLLLVLYGCRIQLVALYFLQYIRRKTVGWRVQYLPAAERKVSIRAGGCSVGAGNRQTCSSGRRLSLYYVQSGTGNTVLCAGSQFVWDSIRHCLPCAGVGLCVSQHHHAAERNSEAYSSPKNGAKCGRCGACWRRT